MSMPRASKSRSSTLPAAGLACAALTAIFAGRACAQAVWDVHPYGVKLVIAFAPVAELTPRLQADLRDGLAARFEALVGGVWRVDVVGAPEPLRYAMGRRLLSVDRNALEEHLPEVVESDKVFLIRVAPSGAGYRVTAREYDVRTQIWNGPRFRNVLQLGKLCGATFEAVVEAFAPLARIEADPGGPPMLNLRAGALPTRDPTLKLVHEEELFRPVIRYNDREGNPQRINEILWTFLRLQGESSSAAEGKRLPCTLHSGLRIALTGRRRGRMERLALGVVPDPRPTRLTLVSRKGAQRRLAGYEILVQAPGSKQPALLGRTDARGEIDIEPATDLLRVLLVRHGSEYLARLPVVPGVHPSLEAPIPDDDRRLEAEAYVKGFQQRLIDLVARRKMLIEQVTERVKQKEQEPAEELFSALRGLPDHEELSRELEDEMKRLLREEGTAASDPLVKQRVEKLFADAQALVQRHLDPAPVEDLSRKLAELQR